MRFPHDPPQDILILLPPERNFVVLAALCHGERQPNHLPLLIVVLSTVEGPDSPCHPRRAQAPCHPDRAKRAEGSAALLYRPWYLLSLLRLPARLLRFCSRGTHRLAVPCYRCRGFAFLILLLQKKCCIAAFRFIFSSKEEWKTAHANKNAFASFSIPLFSVQALASWMLFYRPEQSRRICLPLPSFMSPRAAVERSDGRGRFPGFGPPDLRSE